MRKLLLLLVSLSFVWSASVMAQVVYLSENFNSGALPNGWSNNATGTTNAQWTFGTNNGNNINGTSMVFWDDDANFGFGDRPQLISPVINLSNATDPVLEFVYNYRDWPYADEEFFVEVFNGSSWVRVLTVGGSDQCGAWDCTPKPKANISLNTHKNANFRVRFTYDDDNDWNWWVGFDDVLVRERPTCFDPINFSASNVQSTTARFNWTTTNGAGRDYEIEYGVPGFAPGTGTRIGIFTGTTVAGANLHNATGLTPSTNYQAYVREKCTNPTSNSFWVGPIEFSTTDAFTFQSTCNANVTLFSGSCPNREELTLSVSGMPNRLDGQQLEIKSVSTVVSMINWASQVRLTLRAPNGTEIPLFNRPTVVVGSNIGNPAGGCGAASLCNFSDNANVAINSNVAPVPTAPFIGTWRPVAPLSQLYTGLNPNGTWRLLGCIDNFYGNGAIQYFRIRFTDCFNLANFNLSNISTTQASFTFDSRQPNKNFVIEYGTPGFVPGSGTRIGEVTGLTVNGVNTASTPNTLTANTNYQAYVRTVCSANSQSDWIGPINFKTSFIVTPTIPFVERFDACILPFGWANTFQPLIAGPWLITDGFTAPAATYMTGGSRSGFGCFAWVDDDAPGNAGAESYLTMQVLDLSGVSLPELNFFWQNSNGGTKSPASISNPTGVPPLWSEVYVDVSTDMGRNFTQIARYGGVPQSGWRLGALDLTNFKSTRTLIRFRCRETNSFYSDLSIDDIQVRESPNMTFTSSTTTQTNTLGIVRGETNDVIIGIEIDTDNGFANPLPVTSFSFNTNGSSNASGDIAAAKVFYTGTSAEFTPQNQFGATTVNPNGNFTINGLQNLTRGKNYFWLTYDVRETATLGNVVDAQCTSVTVNNIARTPSVTNPIGSRAIVGRVIYITTTGSGLRDGTSWENASPNLTAALSIVVPKQQIWVAQGVYTPGTLRASTFTLVEGVSMYGGFIGNETSIDQRSWRANQTILSGDIGTINVNSDNSFHILTVPSNVSALVDGFVFDAGNANGGGEDRFGGAVFARPGSKVTFNQCWFRNNIAIFGGAIMGLNSSPTVRNSIFQTNSTPSGSGGALYVIGAGETFSVQSSIFVDNSAGARGGCFQAEGGKFLVQNCAFSSNRITLTGTTSRGAVGSALNNGIIEFYNCSANNNNAGSSMPGDFLALGAPAPTGPGFARVENSILWNRSNLGNEIFLEGVGSLVTVNACIIDQDSYVGINRNQSVDPFFRDANGPDNIFGTPDDNLSVRTGSLAIDSADAITALPMSIDGFNRDSRPDIGAYEFFPCPVPTDLRLVKGGPTSVQVGWQSGGSNVWDIEYMPAGGALGTGTRVTTSNNPFTIRNLNPLTAYQFFVRDNCIGSNNGTSFWVGPFAFSTSSINDECDGALELIVTRNCNNFLGSNIGSTNSTPDVGFNPICGNYRGADVWFKATVPSSGSLTLITSNSGGINNTGVEVYRGTCSGLTSIACADNNNPNAPGFEQVTVTSQVPGDPIYVRVWQQGANQFGTFNICATRIPVILVNDVESNENVGSMRFTLRLSEPDPNNTITVNYSTSNGTALSGLDYTARSGVVSFAPGEISKTIDIPIIDDNLNEDPETFFVNFNSPNNAILGRSSVTGTILDNDPLPKISITGASVIEGGLNSTTVVNVTVRLTPASGRPVRFTYRTTSNTAEAPDDYDLIASTNELLPAGTTLRNYQVTVKGDLIDEGDFESFFFTIENVINADLTNPQAEIIITDDDNSPVALDDLNYNVNEDNILIVDRANAGVGANDSDKDGDPLTFFVRASTSNGKLTTDNDHIYPDGLSRYIDFMNIGAFVYAPDPDYWSNPAKGDLGDQFTYRAFDGYNYSNVARARINVRPVNDAPVMRAIPDFSLCAGQLSTTRVSMPLYVSDIDDNILAPDFRISISVIDASSGLSPADLTNIVNPLSKEIVFSTNVKTQGFFTVSVTAMDKEGLTATQTFKIKVGADLLPNLVYTNSCLGSLTQLRSVSTSVDGLIQFTYWDFDNDGNFDDEGFAVRHIFKNEGANLVKMRVVNEFGCQKDSIFSVMIAPPIIPSISQNRDKLTASEGTSYQWFYEGEGIPPSLGGDQKVLTIRRLGKYQVRVTNALGCTNTSSDFEVTTLNVEDISESVSLYPNPANDFAVVEMSNDLMGAVNISVTDILGRKVSNFVVDKNANRFSYKINTEKWSSGIYIVQLKIGEFAAVHKLEKE